MQTRLPFEKSLSFVRLGAEDAKKQTDHAHALKELLLANEGMYPGISQWTSRRVLPGLKSGERSAYVAYEGETPVASAVVKRGEKAKFCHLHIHERLRGRGVGEALFTLMALDVRGSAREIHFTLPESLWEEKSSFFRSFGFTERSDAGTQYRLFERELRCSASWSEVWRTAQRKLPRVLATLSGADAGDALLMSLKPRWADAILQGNKRVEIRKAFSPRWTNGKVFLYAALPEQRIVGEARVAAVVKGRPEEIWERFGSAIGCGFEELKNYTQGSEAVYAIELDDAKPYTSCPSLQDLREVVGVKLRPPQSHAGLDAVPDWACAVALSTWLREEQPEKVRRRRTDTR